MSNITSIKEPGANGVFADSTDLRQNFSYDQRNRLIRATYTNPGNTQLGYDYKYEYNGSDDRTKLTTNTTEIYNYHAYNQNVLTSVKRGTQTETFTHDAAGAMTSRTFAGVTTQYSYDRAGRLKEVKTGSTPIAKYEYDAYGRLVRTTEGTQVTIRLPLGNETAYEKVITPGMPTVERRYIIALGRYIARDETTAGLTSRVYYHGDHLGSTRAISGDDTGSFTYDPFGNIVNSTGDAADHSHQFTGKPIHSTGLYYYGARFYDPTLGRFINMDPAKDGNNWWVYCANNPLRYVDPDGRYVIPLNPGLVDVSYKALLEIGSAVIGFIIADSLSTDVKRDDETLRLAHYTSLEAANNIIAEQRIKPSSWEYYVYALKEPSTVDQAKNIGANIVEVKVTFDLPGDWIRDEGASDPNAYRKQTQGSQYIGHLNPKIEPIVQPRRNIWEHIVNWFRSITKD